jgi:DNA end-binding protein Ku
MQSVWSGVIGFGLVNIPIRMYSPAKEEAIDLDLLHKDDKSPIRYARICKEEEKEISWNDIERGFKTASGRYVVLKDADFAKANARKTKAIDILHFADADEIDPVYFEKPYYLEPEARSVKPYMLLRRALEETGKVGVATFVMRHKESLAVIKPYKNILVLDQLRFPQNVKSPDGLNVPKAKDQAVSAKELKIAIDLVRKSTEKFKPKDHEDRYINELKAIIDKKSRGMKIKANGKAPIATRSSDLMAALKRSLAQRRRQEAVR